MNSIFWGEFLGTMVLIYLGNGVVANVLLAKTKGNGTGLNAIAPAWAFSVIMGIFVATYFGSAGAHLNPAVTVAACVSSGDWSNCFTYIAGQMLGAMLGQTLVWIHYNQHYNVTEDAGLILATHSTGPAIPHTFHNFVSEFLGTFVLGLVGATLTSINHQTGPFMVGILVWVIGLSLGGPTGYAINPARDLGPRIMHALLPIKHKGSSNWGYAWIPVIAPICGAIVGALVAGLAK